MRFIPYEDEEPVIDCVQKVQAGEYELIRLTKTMLDKSIIDVKPEFRQILKTHGIVDYDRIDKEDPSIPVEALLFTKESDPLEVTVNFYKATGRGDPRMSISGSKSLRNKGLLEVGDLLYLACTTSGQLFIVNLTEWTPSKELLQSVIGLDSTKEKLIEIIPALKEIINGGYFPNSKGPGKVSPKDVGDTLESLLHIKTNNSAGADIDGLIELKAKVAKNTKQTLFTLRPRFENTYVESIEPVDRNRVSAFTRVYGYDSEKHPGYNSLYVTIGNKSNPQNGHGLYLDVNEKEMKISLKHKNDQFNKNNKDNKNEVAFWYFDDLKKAFEKKHPATLWIESEMKTEGDLVYFKYTNVSFSRSPSFSAFLDLVAAGRIVYDWRGYTTKEGKYSGKNHGNGFRVIPKFKSSLFGEIEQLDL